VIIVSGNRAPNLGKSEAIETIVSLDVQFSITPGTFRRRYLPYVSLTISVPDVAHARDAHAESDIERLRIGMGARLLFSFPFLVSSVIIRYIYSQKKLWLRSIMQAQADMNG
jgi:hypothetical protein